MTGFVPPGCAADTAWDAGGLGCGALVLELGRRLEAMRPGQVLRLTALDPGAPSDVPAWCRLTGHELLAAAPPTYLIKRKERWHVQRKKLPVKITILDPKDGIRPLGGGFRMAFDFLYPDQITYVNNAP